MSTYWSRRQAQLAVSLEKDEAKLKKRLTAYYSAEYSALDKEIAAYYQKYGVDSVIEYRRLLETLPDDDRRLLIERMDDFAEKYPQYKSLLPVRESIYKLDRLEGLQYSVRLHQLNIGAITNEEVTAHLHRQALRGANAAAETMGFGKNFYNERSDIVNKFVGTEWSNGKNFSERIWENTDKLADYLNTDIAQGFARGETYEKLTQRLQQRFENVSQRDAYRLIYTEGTYVMNEASIAAFEDDFTYYRLSPVGDGKACSVCVDVSRSTFEIKNRQPGVNFPPMHPYCRCSYEIVVDDWDKWIDDYVARHQNDTARIEEVSRRFAEKLLCRAVESDKIKATKLTDDEEYAISQYIGSWSYIINAKLRSGASLTSEEKKLIKDLDSALMKMPEYKGTVTRSLSFVDADDLENFLKDYAVGNYIQYIAYTSTTKGKTYNPSGQVQIVIDNSKHGRDISSYNPEENEVLYLRNSRFLVAAVKKVGEKTFILLQEE